MTVLNTLRQTGRAAVLAVVLAGTALSAVPVQAAPLGGFSLDVKPQGGENQKQFQQFSTPADALSSRSWANATPRPCRG